MARKRKRRPTIHICQCLTLTGDALNRNATEGGDNAAMAIEPENPAWARNAHSSLRGLMTLTRQRGVVIVY